MDETCLYHYYWRQSNNQWSGGIAAHSAPNNSECKNPWKSSRLDFLGSRRHPPIDCLPKDQSINAEYYSSLLVQLKDILKEKRCVKFTKGVLYLHDNATAHWALTISSSPTLFSGSGPVGLQPVPWTEKSIERSPFFSDAEVISTAETWLDGQYSELF